MVPVAIASGPWPSAGCAVSVQVYGPTEGRTTPGSVPSQTAVSWARAGPPVTVRTTLPLNLSAMVSVQEAIGRDGAAVHCSPVVP